MLRLLIGHSVASDFSVEWGPNASCRQEMILSTSGSSSNFAHHPISIRFFRLIDRVDQTCFGETTQPLLDSLLPFKVLQRLLSTNPLSEGTTSKIATFRAKCGLSVSFFGNGLDFHRHSDDTSLNTLAAPLLRLATCHHNDVHQGRVIFLRSPVKVEPL
jgi:hypothetical protein